MAEVCLPLVSEKYAGFVAKVDRDLLDEVSLHVWRPIPRKSALGGFYAAACAGRRTLYLHRHVAALRYGKSNIIGLEVDHINGDWLDNRAENLRLSNRALQCARSPTRQDHKFRGVEQQHSRFRATAGKRLRTMFRFDNDEEAAIERDKMALRLYGKFAVLNFPEKRDAHAAEGPTWSLWPTWLGLETLDGHVSPVASKA